jgi:hypothetical protein
MKIQTLRAVVEAIGGQLEIVARFGNDAVRIGQFDVPEAVPAPESGRPGR